MEARFLQIELEALKEDELVFLDSDDLRDLTKLIDHVQKSRCLILVLTRKVLTRPYCILEVLTAIEARIPIVCVTVAGKPNDTYDFEEMSKMMLWMDSELEQWNPGAADVLRDHGYDDLTEVAYRLSTTVPNTIAVGLNTGASRNMLRATIEDVVSSVDEARAILAEKQTPGPSEKAAWLATREKQQRPVPTVKSPRTQDAACYYNAVVRVRARRGWPAGRKSRAVCPSHAARGAWSHRRRRKHARPPAFGLCRAGSRLWRQQRDGPKDRVRKHRGSGGATRAAPPCDGR